MASSETLARAVCERSTLARQQQQQRRLYAISCNGSLARNALTHKPADKQTGTNGNATWPLAIRDRRNWPAQLAGGFAPEIRKSQMILSLCSILFPPKSHSPLKLQALGRSARASICCANFKLETNNRFGVKMISALISSPDRIQQIPVCLASCSGRTRRASPPESIGVPL